MAFGKKRALAISPAVALAAILPKLTAPDKSDPCPFHSPCLELLGGPGEIALNANVAARLRAAHRTLLRLAGKSSRQNEWRIHKSLTAVWGELFVARDIFRTIRGDLFALAASDRTIDSRAASIPKP